MMGYFFERNHAVIEHGILKSIDRSSLVVIPEKTETIMGLKEESDMNNDKYGRDIFYSSLNQNDDVRRVVLPDKGVKSIGEKAFEHCHGLTDINFPEGLLEIRMSAFLGCYRLVTVRLPKSLKLLDEWCFALIEGLIVNYEGTTEEWNMIRKAPDWAKKGTIVNTSDGEFVL